MPIHKSRCQDRIEPLHRQRVRLKGTNVESNRAVEDCLEFMSRPIFLLTAGVYAARGSTFAAQRGAGLSRQRRNVNCSTLLPASGDPEFEVAQKDE